MMLLSPACFLRGGGDIDDSGGIGFNGCGGSGSSAVVVDVVEVIIGLPCV